MNENFYKNDNGTLTIEYTPLFNYFYKHFKLTLTEEEIMDIYNLCMSIQSIIDPDLGKAITTIEDLALYVNMVLENNKIESKAMEEAINTEVDNAIKTIKNFFQKINKNTENKTAEMIANEFADKKLNVVRSILGEDYICGFKEGVQKYIENLYKK